MRLARWSFLIAALLVLSLTIVVVAQGQAGQGGGQAGPGAGAPAQGDAAPAAGGGGGGRGGRGGGGGGGGGRGGGGNNANAAPPAPAPRWPDGKIRLSAPPGEVGLWFGEFGGGSGDTPQFLPWARGVLDYRRINELEPHARCKVSGVVRQFQTPYGVDIIDIPETKVIYIVDVGGPHTVRTIYLDGREHPKEIVPSGYGHSIGKWEGDTLVVDTIGFSEKFWLDRAGTPHTEQMRVTERWTRTNMTTMRYEYTVNDPLTYTAPWTRTATISWRTNQELFEYICQDNNLGSELMVGGGEFVDRSSRITP